jgi:hypothetical protein
MRRLSGASHAWQVRPFALHRHADMSAIHGRFSLLAHNFDALIESAKRSAGKHGSPISKADH